MKISLPFDPHKKPDGVCTTVDQWNDVMRRAAQLLLPGKECHDEQVWTFVILGTWAQAGRLAELAQILTGAPVAVSPDDKVWLEALPMPPRMKEGNTNLDAALGAIAQRRVSSANGDSAGEGNGIAYTPRAHSWICFCEMKWNSDISTHVTHDPHRNQLARVIENALCFQDEQGNLADAVYVTLVTPSAYRVAKPRSRFYAYKYGEYQRDRHALIQDMQACLLDKRGTPGSWKYPESEIEARALRLGLNWITFEELIEPIRDAQGMQDIYAEFKDSLPKGRRRP